MRRSLLLTCVLALTLVGCGEGDAGEIGPTTVSSSDEIVSTTTTNSTTGSNEQTHPEIVDVEAELEPDGTYRFVVTVSSPYDSPSRYADAWRVLTEDGTVLGIRELTHDHANEQPFTRSLGGVEIPKGISQVIVEGRDLVNGWGGGTQESKLPGR